ncbi:MAG TPA: hypothetical protein DCY07_01530, partial [Rhodospirillaceae bacterium]|nr:hypothetical protein [Rhodospirillaceae bacterium]
EDIYTLSGTLKLTPRLDIKTRAYRGRSKVKGLHILPNHAALEADIKERQESFSKDATWIDAAVAEIKKTEGFGWGQHDATLIWDNKTTILAATENCPSCKGAMQHPCNDCHGLGFTVCQYCEGRGQEHCYHCNGRGEDPVNPGKTCPICNGTRFAICRQCQNTGKLPCPTCQGRGQTPCAQCQGAGVMTREAHIKSAARLSFSLGSTSGLPSGLLRAISRIGEDKIFKGHADVTIKPAAAPETADKTTILLEAKIAYADLKMRIGTKSGIVSCVGKLARLSGVPAFLDESLTDARRELVRAAHGAVPLEQTLTVRVLSDALKLALTGKVTPNDLRRLYPVGLSGEAAKEIMDNMTLALKTETRSTRIMTAILCIIISGAVFAGVLMTSFLSALPSITALLVKAALPVIVLGVNWAILTQTARWGLKRKFPTIAMTSKQNIGRTGYATLAAILVLYGAIVLAQRYFGG